MRYVVLRQDVHAMIVLPMSVMSSMELPLLRCACCNDPPNRVGLCPGHVPAFLRCTASPRVSLTV